MSLLLQCGYIRTINCHQPIRSRDVIFANYPISVRGRLLPFTFRISAGGSSVGFCFCVSLCISFVTKPLFHSHHGNEGNGLETIVVLLSIFFIKCFFVMTWRIWNGHSYKTVGWHSFISLPVYITYNFALDFGLPQFNFFLHELQWLIIPHYISQYHFAWN